MPLQPLINEFKIFLLFSWRDWSVTIIPGTIFASGFLRSRSSYPASLIISNYALINLWLSLFIYSFNLSTQCYSIEEDSINKPDRPLPSGKVTLDGARKRLRVVYTLLFLLVTYKPCIILETLCEVAATVFLCHAEPQIGGHWFIKNTAMMTLMNWPLLSVPWKLMAQPPATLAMERHIPALCLWVGIVAYAQDFRDQEGDKAMGRMTLPLAFGNSSARYMFVFGMLPMALVLLWQQGFVQLAPWILISSHALAGYRILALQDKRQDHKSYMVRSYI